MGDDPGSCADRDAGLLIDEKPHDILTHAEYRTENEKMLWLVLGHLVSNPV